MTHDDVSTPPTRHRFAIADGGIETALDERLGQVLPEFAAFTLLETETGRAALAEYYRPFVELAATNGLSLVLDTPTWRASPDWGALLGYDADLERYADVRDADLQLSAGAANGPSVTCRRARPAGRS